MARDAYSGTSANLRNWIGRTRMPDQLYPVSGIGHPTTRANIQTCEHGTSDSQAGGFWQSPARIHFMSYGGYMFGCASATGSSTACASVAAMTFARRLSAVRNVADDGSAN